jgi:hypothetical protein
MSSVFRKIRKSDRQGALKKKVFVEILDAIGGIPEGIYEVEEMQENGFVLHIQHKVFLGILDKSYCKYRFISSDENPECTRLEEFLVRYWKQVDASKNHLICRKYSEPVTFCVMDKRIQGYV